MSEPNRIDQTLPKPDRSSRGQIDVDGEISEHALGDPTLTAARWFMSALDASDEKIDLGVDAAHVTRMRKGEKSIPMRHLVELLGNREAVLAFVKPLLASIGHTAIARPKMSRRRAEKHIAAVVRRSTDLFQLVKGRAAEEAGVDTDEIDLALEFGEEVTKF